MYESVFQLVDNHKFCWLSNSSTPVFVFGWCMQSPVVSKSNFHVAMIGEQFIKCLERQRRVWWAIMHWFQEPATWRCVNAVAEPLCRTHVDHVGRLNRSKNIDVALVHNGSNHLSTACIWIYVRFERTVTSIVRIWICVRLRKLLIPHLLRVSKLWSFAKFEYCLAGKSPKYQKYRSC